MNYSTAIPIIMGQNVGTCVTALLSSVGASKNARRAALIHLYYNIIKTVAFMAVFYTLNAIFHFSFMDKPIPALGVAFIHTAFNIVAVVIMFPVSFVLEKLAYLSIPQGEEELEELTELQDSSAGGGKDGFRPADKLTELYLRGKDKHAENPEEYAVKNWLVRVQGFLIDCATYGFTSNYRMIMQGDYRYDLFCRTYAEKLMELLGDLAFREVFTSDAIYKMEVAEGAMLDFLLDLFMNAVVGYDDGTREMDSLSRRMVALISSNYKRAYRCQAEGKGEAERLYLRLLLATDYICGMTDSYAKRLYQELKAIL